MFKPIILVSLCFLQLVQVALTALIPVVRKTSTITSTSVQSYPQQCNSDHTYYYTNGAGNCVPCPDPNSIVCASPSGASLICFSGSAFNGQSTCQTCGVGYYSLGDTVKNSANCISCGTGRLCGAWSGNVYGCQAGYSFSYSKPIGDGYVSDWTIVCTPCTGGNSFALASTAPNTCTTCASTCHAETGAVCNAGFYSKQGLPSCTNKCPDLLAATCSFTTGASLTCVPTTAFNGGSICTSCQSNFYSWGYDQSSVCLSCNLNIEVNSGLGFTCDMTSGLRGCQDGYSNSIVNGRVRCSACASGSWVGASFYRTVCTISPIPVCIAGHYYKAHEATCNHACPDQYAATCSSPSGASLTCQYAHGLNGGTTCQLCPTSYYSTGNQANCQLSAVGSTCNPGNGVVNGCLKGYTSSISHQTGKMSCS